MGRSQAEPKRRHRCMPTLTAPAAPLWPGRLLREPWLPKQARDVCEMGRERGFGGIC